MVGESNDSAAVGPLVCRKILPPAGDIADSITTQWAATELIESVIDKSEGHISAILGVQVEAVDVITKTARKYRIADAWVGKRVA